MTTLGRDDVRIIEEGLRLALRPVEKALVRSADANEALLDIAKQETVQMEVEAGPPVCPKCGMLNPTVFMEHEAGSGPLNEMIFKFEMHCCNSVVYAVPEGWQMSDLMQEVVDIIQQRAGVTK